MYKVKNSKKIRLLIIAITIVLTFLSSNVALATTLSSNNLKQMEYSEEYKKWLDLPEEEKNKVMMPNMYDIEIKTDDSEYLNSMTNVFKLNKLLRATASTNISKFDLREVIGSNLKVKDQGETGGCWAFAMVAALETLFAREDKENGQVAEVYDFSERHMVYATVREAFLNNVINEKGFSKEISGGNKYLAQAYMTNGSGAIKESDMPFENNEDLIDIQKIQNKNVETTLIDSEFLGTPSTEEERKALIEDVKQHIRENGGVWASLHGASIDTDCYNNSTGALYTNNSIMYPADHAILIIGWNDEYEIENFNEAMRPKNPGAWIIKNSWGSKIEYSMTQFKQWIYEANKSQYNSINIYSAEDVPMEHVEIIVSNYKNAYGQNKVEVTNEKITITIGDDGFMYVSYEDSNIMSNLYKIVEAKNYEDYDNIYQYDYLGINNQLYLTVSSTITKGYISNVFKSKSNNEELTKVSISTLVPYEQCKVYVNPEGTSKKYEDLQLVDLAEGEYEKLEAGYNTIEFANPIKITGDSFVIVVELSIDKKGRFYIPVNMAESETYWNDVKVEKDMSFVTWEGKIESDNWINMTDTEETGGIETNLTIKAFTNDIKEEVISLSSIEIEKAPTKTTYNVGDKFDKTGMIVNAVYTNGTKKAVTNYMITNGDSLELNQKTVTISYTENEITKTITQEITVNKPKPTLTKIEVKQKPTKLEYIQNQDELNLQGGIITAIYSDSTTKDIEMTNSEVKVAGYDKTKVGKQIITITYEEKVATFEVTVKANESEPKPEETPKVTLTKIEVKQKPTKLEYIQNQEELNLQGGIITATYSDGATKNIEMTNSKVKASGYDKTKVGKQIITITYEEKVATFEVIVKTNESESKPEETPKVTLTKIEIKAKPTKLEYTQNKDELNLAGGIITATYSDKSTQDILMTNSKVKVTGYDKTKVGKQTITLTYEEKVATFEVTVKANESESKPEETPKVTLTKIEIKAKPTQLEYTQNKEELNLAGGIITAIYSDKSMEDILMTNSKVKVTGYDKTKVGKQTITVTYEGKSVNFEITVKEVPKRTPTLSSFKDAKANMTKAISYIYIKKDKTEYSTMTIKLDGIEKGDKDSTREFYYYLSGKKGETSITSSNWTKFDMTSSDGKYSANINIDTRNVKNASEIAESESLYVYVKEIAKLDGNTTQTVNVINVKKVVDVEVYLDDVKQSDLNIGGTQAGSSSNSETLKGDDTVAKEPIPQTGVITVGIVIIAILAVGILSYIRYRNIDK